MGFTGLALGAMLAQDRILRADAIAKPQAAGVGANFKPKAKSVIWLFMNGGV